MLQGMFIVYPFKPVVLIPSTIYLCKDRNITISGIRLKTDMANIAPQSVMEFGSENNFNAMETVYKFGLFK
jgi:hypothetical protein